MAKKKLTKHQLELIKKFGKSRAKQKKVRAQFAQLRIDLKKAISAFVEHSDSLSDGKRMIEVARLKRIANSAIKKIG